MKSTLDRFFEKVELAHVEDGCSLWWGYLSKRGYGLFSIDGRRIGAHRASWEIHNGPIPAGLDVCHKCDNPSCVRPDHLFLGTEQENLDDMKRKGRAATGDRNGVRKHPERVARGDRSGPKLYPEKHQGAFNGATKLTDHQVVEIRQLSATGTSQAELGRRFKVSAGAVGHIVRGETWKQLL